MQYLMVRLFIIFSAMLAFFAAAGVVRAQEADQAQLKVALVYNFIMYTEWPANAWDSEHPFFICISQSTETQAQFHELQTRWVSNRRIRIRQLTENADAAACDVIYLEGRSRAWWPHFKKSIAGKSVLTIAGNDIKDNDDFVISLALVNSRMAFDINSSAAREAGLNLSSKLLRLARKVN